MRGLALDGTVDRGEGFGEREDVGRDEQIRILGADGMPIDAFGRDRHFGDEVGPCQRDALFGKAAKGDAADHAILNGDLPLVEETAELLGLAVARYRRREAHAKSVRPDPLDALPGPRPCALAAMAVVAL